MLVPTLDIVRTARKASPRYGVLAFNVIGLEHAAAIIAGAEAEQASVILRISQNTVRYWGGLISPLASACVALAERSSVPVTVHLDHATGDAICREAIESGVNSIMFDASANSLEENIRETARIVAWAHDLGIAIEGEIGIVGGKDGVSSSAETYTDPEEGARFIEGTNVDMLAVAIGTEHGMVDQHAVLDLARLDDLAGRLDIPLVLHGSSGVPLELMPEVVRRGITKINVATQLNVAYMHAVRTTLVARPDITDPRIYGDEGRRAMTEVVRRYCTLVRPGH